MAVRSPLQYTWIHIKSQKQNHNSLCVDGDECSFLTFAWWCFSLFGLTTQWACFSIIPFRNNSQNIAQWCDSTFLSRSCAFHRHVSKNTHLFCWEVVCLYHPFIFIFMLFTFNVNMLYNAMNRVYLDGLLIESMF